MKTIMRVIGSILVGGATVAYASQGVESESSGVLAYLFVGFFALIVVTQLVPAMILFFGMVKGLFVKPQESDASVARVD